jgi:hypothetical protein
VLEVAKGKLYGVCNCLPPENHKVPMEDGVERMPIGACDWLTARCICICTLVEANVLAFGWHIWAFEFRYVLFGV